MLERALLYFIPNQGRDDIAEGGEFLKIQPGTGNNLSPKDIAEGYTDYVIWNRFRPECLDIDGELPMECVDSGIVLLKGDPRSEPGMTLADILEQAYGDKNLEVRSLIKE